MRVSKRIVLTLVAIVLATAGVAPAQQPGLRVYISADMEGITGLTHRSQVSQSGPDYALGRKLMTAEVNTAIAAGLRPARPKSW